MQNDFGASKLRKAFLVAANLFAHPRLIAPYFAMRKRDPIAVRLPWISFSAIRALESLLTHSMFAFEYGSGGSTLFFARRCQSVLSIEDRADWAERVSSGLQSLKLDTAVLRHVH